MADLSPPPEASAPADPNAKSILLLITYLIPIVAIYTMMKKSDNPFFVHHSKNAFGYLILLVALNILFRLIWVIVPSLAVSLGTILNLVTLALFIMVVVFGMLPAWKGKERSIPLISAIGQKIPLEKWFGHPSFPSSGQTEAPTEVAPTVSTPATSAPSPAPAPAPEPQSLPTSSPSTPIPAPTAPSVPSEPTNNPPSPPTAQA